MKKLLFVLAFTFIGQQAFSQMYMVSIQSRNVNSCGVYEVTLTTISPAGTITKTCIPRGTSSGSSLTWDPNPGLALINQELNSIMSQGYKLINMDYGYLGSSVSANGLVDDNYIVQGATFYLALP
jgi:hypothetical protein